MNIETLKQRAKAFDYLFDAVVVTDLEGNITDWNKGSETLYGYSKDEAIGKHVNMLHVPEDSAHITADVISAVLEQGHWSGEVRMLHKDGHIGWIESMCVPTFDEDGQMNGALGVNRDITERRNEKERLNQLAYYDQLTKIPNRYLFLDRIAHLIAQSERNEKSFALFFIDIDNFKNINDTKGHVFGDEILVETANRLKNFIRDSDTVARMGGDEFVLLLEDISNKENASVMAEKLLQILNQAYVSDNRLYEFSSSIGIAIYPENGKTKDALLASADKAMYKAKHNERGTFEF
jgi:diguanylate cyclase (GGDEF)-like protein/PAS domain S-box-containing protein